MTHDDTRRILLEIVTPDDIRQMARALADKARAGDVAACELLLSYLIGPTGEAEHAPRRQ